MSEADFALLEQHLEAVDLPVRMTLEARDRRVDRVYFPESGFASVVANGSGRSGVEIGVIGREGMTGIPVLLGNGVRVPNETYVQMEGHGQRLPADRLREAIDRSPTLHKQLLGFVHSFMTQTARTAVSNALHKIEERLARC